MQRTKILIVISCIVVLSVLVQALGYGAAGEGGTLALPEEHTDILYKLVKDNKLGIMVTIPSDWTVIDGKNIGMSGSLILQSPDFRVLTHEAQHPEVQGKKLPIGAEDTITAGARFLVEVPQQVNQKLWNLEMDGILQSERTYFSDGRDGFVLTSIHKAGSTTKKYRIHFDYSEFSADNQLILAAFIAGFKLQN